MIFGAKRNNGGSRRLLILRLFFMLFVGFVGVTQDVFEVK
eukprot:CAMPEP_0204549212 /NCGR_PEP_ID=MMETSP0661-20131031/24171_1 /ASSEMBLY_ACC=CAM_ASM_000606 /TAXON_ID=109239 /ORGANISM="Alexandrium margalefi, Strain AMGDE01CS-322" /LENGTH=39 /DNA_ID= /DNA_START= /DNA_END= /DNA_ORIENTATION=